MTHPSHPFITFSRFAVSATGLCLTLLFACGGSTEGNSNDDATDGNTGGSGPTDGNSGGSGPTDGNSGGSGPTDGNSGGSGPTDGGPNNGNSGGTGGGGNCPSLEPAEGTSCSQEFQVCDYVNCAPPDPRNDHTLECLNGAWALAAETVCDDVSFSCPPNVYRGAYCSAPEGAGPCTVYDACGAFRDVYCTNGVWEYGSVDRDSDGAAPPPDGGGGVGTAIGTAPSATVTTSPPPVPTCPDYAPIQGTGCCPSDYPAYCDYTDAGSDSAVVTAASISTATVVGGFGGGAFGGSTVTTGNGGGAGTGGEDVAPIVTCAVCDPESLTWQPSGLCQ